MFLKPTIVFLFRYQYHSQTLRGDVFHGTTVTPNSSFLWCPDGKVKTTEPVLGMSRYVDYYQPSNLYISLPIPIPKWWFLDTRSVSTCDAKNHLAAVVRGYHSMPGMVSVCCSRRSFPHGTSLEQIFCGLGRVEQFLIGGRQPLEAGIIHFGSSVSLCDPSHVTDVCFFSQKQIHFLRTSWWQGVITMWPEYRVHGPKYSLWDPRSIKKHFSSRCNPRHDLGLQKQNLRQNKKQKTKGPNLDKLPGNPECDTAVIFTDSACETSCDAQARRAGFAIVIDTSRDDYERIQILESFAKSGTIPDCFSVLTTARNWGNPFLRTYLDS